MTFVGSDIKSVLISPGPECGAEVALTLWVSLVSG